MSIDSAVRSQRSRLPVPRGRCGIRGCGSLGRGRATGRHGTGPGRGRHTERMTEPAQRPKRPPVLIAALVALPLAALLFGMTATNLDGPGGSSAGLPSAAILISLLAIR